MWSLLRRSRLLQRYTFTSVTNQHLARNKPLDSFSRGPLRSFSNTYPRYDQSTIYALSTAPGKAAIAVIRVSGPACTKIYSALCPDTALPKPRRAALRTLYKPYASRDRVDVLDGGALVLYFPAPETVTGEDVLELHVHGGTAVVKAVLDGIPECNDQSRQIGTAQCIRYAEPGEFTRRAFVNDHLDLTQVEALGDVLDATTEQQRRVSVRGTGSELSQRYERWREQLLYARGELEALIDFSEDQHFDESPAALAASVATQVARLKRDINAHCENAMRGELLRSGIRISLLGAPNAGKSSLLNRIIGREAAIVSREQGTTRDIVEVGIDLGGWFCRLGDMAGLRKEGSAEAEGRVSVGDIEREGIERAIERTLASDVLIVVLSVEDDPTGEGVAIHIDPLVSQTAQRFSLERPLGEIVVAVNKVDKMNHDLRSKDYKKIISALGVEKDRIFGMSCRHAIDVLSSRDGSSQQSDPGNIQRFLGGLTGTFVSMTDPTGSDADEASLGASARQRNLLVECTSHLKAFVDSVDSSRDSEVNAEVEDEVDIVVLAESLRAAATCLARITGRGVEAGDVEDVLGVVFEKFCVGK